MIKAVIFDWHGVLDHVTYAQLVERLVKYSGMSRAEVKAVLDGFDSKYIRAKVSQKDFWHGVELGLHISKEQIVEIRRFVNTVDKNNELWDFLPTLKQHYRLAILSDCPQEKADAIVSSTDLSLFEKTYFSAEKGMTKFTPDFFLSLLSDMQLKPEECVFVDDTEKHILTARKLGMQGCLFSELADLLPYVKA